MRETAQALALRAMAVGKYFGDEDPDHRALADRVSGDEGENANRDDRAVRLEEPPGNHAEGSNVAE